MRMMDLTLTPLRFAKGTRPSTARSEGMPAGEGLRLKLSC